jgi:hypothetical protein
MDPRPDRRPCRLTRPQVGRSPTTPPQAAVTPPAPLLAPPVHRSRSQGFRAGSNAWDKRVVPNAVILRLPRSTAPAAFSLAITVASSAGTPSLNMGGPQVVRMPAVLSWALTATGTPGQGPRYAPRARTNSACTRGSRVVVPQPPIPATATRWPWVLVGLSALESG